jgi:imidazoleglycerol phosphate dehydratase HisB
MMKLPQHNMFVHSACCMKHWYLANLPTGGQALICVQCSKAAGVKVKILKETEVIHLGAGLHRTVGDDRQIERLNIAHLSIDGKIAVPGTFVSGCCHVPLELVYQRSGSYKLICESCNADIKGVKVTGPRMNYCAACGRAKR